MMREIFGKTAALLGCYLLLTGNVRWENIVVGLLLALGLVWVMPVSRTVAPRMGRVMLAGPVYLLLVAWDVLLNGLLVAKMVIWPGQTNRPGMVEMVTPLSSQTGRAMHGHAVTISPGQMTMRYDDATMHVHCLDAPRAECSPQDRPSASVRLLRWMIG